MIRFKDLIKEHNGASDIWYHGTSGPKKKKIMLHGFDESKIDGDRSFYGHGIYFSKIKLHGYPVYIAADFSNLKMFPYIANPTVVPARERFMKELSENKSALEVYTDEYLKIEYGRFELIPPEDPRRKKFLSNPIFQENVFFYIGDKVLQLMSYDGVIIDRGDDEGGLWACVYDVAKANASIVRS